MTLKIHLRRFAAALLHSALKIAPPHAAEWGRAMVAELHHVEGDWAALAWAVGGAGVLARHALLSLIIPGHANQIATSGGKFFAKEKPMRKSTLIGAAVCLAASLLFFAAPTFRQAFQLCLMQWQSLVGSLYGGSNYGYAPPNFARIADQARKHHDAEGLAFVASHGWGSPSAASLADEAVGMDPKLTWLYAVVAGRNWSRPEIDEWIGKLEQFDPQNAVPHLIAAERDEYRSILGGKYRLGQYKNDPAWQNAMAAAFASSKLDTYADRIQQLDHDVSRRYGIDDPFQLESQYFLSMGIPLGLGNSVDYANSLLNAGDALEARGDHAGAAKQYWTVVHFGELMQPPQRRTFDAFRSGIFANIFLEAPYRHLAAFYAKRGDPDQAQLLNYLAAATERARNDSVAANRQVFGGSPAERWNAIVLGVSGIMLFVCVGVLVACGVVIIAKSRSLQPRKFHARRSTALLACTSAVGVLLSSIALYLSYRPYDEIIRAYLNDGDPARLQTLTAFLSYLNYTAYPPRAGTLYNLHDFPVYFWTTTIALCVLALIFASVKFASKSRRTAAA